MSFRWIEECLSLWFLLYGAPAAQTHNLQLKYCPLCMCLLCIYFSRSCLLKLCYLGFIFVLDFFETLFFPLLSYFNVSLMTIQFVRPNFVWTSLLCYILLATSGSLLMLFVYPGSTFFFVKKILHGICSGIIHCISKLNRLFSRMGLDATVSFRIWLKKCLIVLLIAWM